MAESLFSQVSQKQNSSGTKVFACINKENDHEILNDAVIKELFRKDNVIKQLKHIFQM